MNALKTRSSLADFVANAPCQESWEVGGNCNFLIAASRIGLRCACVGHVGHDKYGALALWDIIIYVDAVGAGNLLKVQNARKGYL